MRLNETEIENIKKLAHLHFGKDVQVILFGSRANDEERGGDIDILINFTTDLILNIGEQKIDVVLDNPAMHGSEFLKTIYRTGIILC